MDFETLRVAPHAIDEDLADAGVVGPEFAHLAQVYVRSPRALIWNRPSPDWRLFVVLLPLGSRLSLIGNPIFTQLARAWGLNLRFVGVDAEGLVYDFRALLSDRTLRRLVDTLDAVLTRPARYDLQPSQADEALDVLFAALADDLLTILDRRRDDWGRHLLREHRLEPQVPQSLFDRGSRYPDFLERLREALRDETIDLHLYGRALRSIDQRETAVEQRLATRIGAMLQPDIVERLASTPVGRHLGCYNWLHLDPRHASARVYALSRLPAFAGFFAESLVMQEALVRHGGARERDELHTDTADALELSPATLSAKRRQVPTLDLRHQVGRSDTAHGLRWGGLLRRAIDAGQDRAIIEALAQRFAVGDNVIRRLWREPPPALGIPPTWHLTQILRLLNGLSDRNWPLDAAGWQALMASAVPAEAD
jgi:hypothetical protein